MDADLATPRDRHIILALRLSMAWVFLYAASHQVLVPGWSVAGFLENTKTFHGFFQNFTGPVMAPVISFLVAYGHLAIGLSLLTGLFVRVSSIAGIALMVLYWMAHMDFPYISNTNNFLLDAHIVNAIVLWLLIVRHAGHFRGLDAWIKETPLARKSSLIGWASA